MTFIIEYHEKVRKDIAKLKLSGTQLARLKRKIETVALNPYPKGQGGLREPLRSNLRGLVKFRFDHHYRVVYRIVEEAGVMRVIVIGMRAEMAVYHSAENRW